VRWKPVDEDPVRIDATTVAPHPPRASGDGVRARVALRERQDRGGNDAQASSRRRCRGSRRRLFRTCGRRGKQRRRRQRRHRCSLRRSVRAGRSRARSAAAGDVPGADRRDRLLERSVRTLRRPVRPQDPRLPARQVGLVREQEVEERPTTGWQYARPSPVRSCAPWSPSGIAAGSVSGYAAAGAANEAIDRMLARATKRLRAATALPLLTAASLGAIISRTLPVVRSNLRYVQLTSSW
jgi:hypothetical protein